MRYTAKISFDNTTYIDIYISNPIDFTTSQERYRYRTKVCELKISKALNSAVYTSLSTWFDDSNKFGNEIHIKFFKGSVEKLNTVFGIKQGVLNKENCYYTVQPETNDAYRYIDPSLKNTSYIPINAFIANYTNENGDFATTQRIVCYDFKECMVSLTSRIASDTGILYNVKSSTFWNDTTPSGGSGNTYFIDDLKQLILKFSSLPTCEMVLSVFEYFNACWYVDENGDIRGESLNYFEDSIKDYKIDLTGKSQIIPEFEYDNKDVYKWEIFKPSDGTGPDWLLARIEYPALMTTFSVLEKIITAGFKTYIEEEDIKELLAYGVSFVLSGFRNISQAFTTFNFVENLLLIDVTAVSISSGAYAHTNYLNGYTTTFDYVIDINYTSGTDRCYMQSKTAENVNVGAAILLENYGVSGTITIETGGYLSFYTTDASAFTMTINLKSARTYRIPWGIGAISGESHPNVLMSWGNVVEKYYLNGRYSKSGKMNENLTAFSSTVYNKKLKEFKMFYEDDINPMHGVLTDYGIARIESFKRDENDIVTFNLTYQEDV